MILDYLRQSDEGTITVPPFHTGHLGFIPGTEVAVSLTWSYEKKEGNCEACVTPFDPSLESMCILDCMMHEGVGVVNRLIDAVASLNVNIVKMETSAINYQNHHRVEMVLDWRTSKYHERRSTPSDLLQRYESVCYRVPLTNYRYVRLYESIIAHCGDVLHHDNAYGALAPALRIVPFSSWQPPQPERTEIRKHQSKSYHVTLQLSQAHIAQIHGLTQHPPEMPLPYVLSSETATRTLRVFFPQREIVPRIFHVAIEHTDMPGALSVITRAVADSGFNILTSLLRKKTAARSGYEAFVECPEGWELPPKVSRRDVSPLLEWFHSKLNSCSDDLLGELARFNAAVTTPEYPRVTKAEPIPIEPRQQLSSRTVVTGSRDRELGRITDALKRVDSREKPHVALDEAQRKAMQTVYERLAKQKPRVFLSYPQAAAAHATLLKEQLGDLVDVREYQLPDFGEIVLQVIERIRDCDYFIGIWHHESLGADADTVSPWMPFEYGVALDAGRDCVVVYSDRLPESIWKRIHPGISHAGYTDLTFASKTVPLIVDYCKTKWLQQPYG